MDHRGYIMELSMKFHCVKVFHINITKTITDNKNNNHQNTLQRIFSQIYSIKHFAFYDFKSIHNVEIIHNECYRTTLYCLTNTGYSRTVGTLNII